MASALQPALPVNAINLSSPRRARGVCARWFVLLLAASGPSSALADAPPDPALSRITVGVELGVSGMNESGPFGFDTGVGTVTGAGPAWGARIGVELTRWLGFEARYIGTDDPVAASVSPTGGLAYVMTGGEAVVRLTAPLRFVHPYVVGGIGYYAISLVGSSTARAGSVLTSSSQAGIPVGVGFDVPLTWRFSVGAEATYRFQLGEKYSAVTTNGIDGGDVSTLTAVVRARL
jgi:hypothetical protein